MGINMNEAMKQILKELGFKQQLLVPEDPSDDTQSDLVWTFKIEYTNEESELYIAYVYYDKWNDNPRVMIQRIYKDEKNIKGYWKDDSDIVDLSTFILQNYE